MRKEGGDVTAYHWQEWRIRRRGIREVHTYQHAALFVREK